MNEEEKKAVEILNTFEFRRKTRNYKIISLEDSKSVKIVLNLLDKLQEENEEYSKQLDLDYVDKNYIPKQKIKAKIEELNKTINKGGIIYSLKQCARCQKDVLEKLLIEESED